VSPQCQNCESFVSDDYVRVFSRDGDDVRACPRCEDLVRSGAEVRESRSRGRANEL